eukprot:NODE_17128_length_960_cov_2.590636.p1 GENE.NODE_17128_length_960_cov_2.590636~~NODE_17128_length_960_cov_2.590636.p1  ORF type:complete len:287 (-),score=51.30 NODE_17128_length_960_cov_2.590636:6-866(-)
MGANCVTSMSIGCLFCCQCCNVEKIKNNFVFLPPQASYTVEVGDPATGGGKGKLSYAIDCLRSASGYRQASEVAEVTFIKTSRGESIPIVWLRLPPESAHPLGAAPKAGPRLPLVLLHCHGNATDIGLMMGSYYELSCRLGIEVVGVEYSGYGASSGHANTRNTLSDIEAAYDHLVASGVDPARIVGYGQSIGTGPVCYLASKRPMGGVVLHSPMLSGIKVMDPQPNRCCRPSCVYHLCDFFPNDQRLRSSPCPAFVMHGQSDDVVPYYHGQRFDAGMASQTRWPW